MNNRCCILMNLASLCIQQLQTQTFDHSEILHLKTKKHLTFQIFHSQGYVFRYVWYCFWRIHAPALHFLAFCKTLKEEENALAKRKISFTAAIKPTMKFCLTINLSLFLLISCISPDTISPTQIEQSAMIKSSHSFSIFK